MALSYAHTRFPYALPCVASCFIIVSCLCWPDLYTIENAPHPAVWGRAPASMSLLLFRRLSFPSLLSSCTLSTLGFWTGFVSHTFLLFRLFDSGPLFAVWPTRDRRWCRLCTYQRISPKFDVAFHMHFVVPFSFSGLSISHFFS